MRTIEKVKHTAGPWRVTIEDYPSIAGNVVISSKITHDCIAQLPKAWSNKEANARLIAAAPELLDALEFAERVLILLKTEVEGLGFNAKNVFPRVKTAIQKARGEA